MIHSPSNSSSFKRMESLNVNKYLQSVIEHTREDVEDLDDEGDPFDIENKQSIIVTPAKPTYYNMPKMSQMLRPEYLNRGTVLSEVDELESEMKGTVYQNRRDSIYELGSMGDINSS